MKEPTTYQCKYCATEHLVGQECTCKGVARLKGKTYICECGREWIKGLECVCELLKSLKQVRKKW